MRMGSVAIVSWYRVFRLMAGGDSSFIPVWGSGQLLTDGQIFHSCVDSGQLLTDGQIFHF